MFLSLLPFPLSLESMSISSGEDLKKKKKPTGKAGNMIVYVENPKKSTKK